MPVTRGFGVRVYIADDQLDFMENIEEVILKSLEAAAHVMVGQGGGVTPLDSIVGKHFKRSNVKRYGFPPLSPKYAKAKEKKYGKRPILVASGDLRDAALSTATIGRDGETVFIEFEVPEYGPYHNEGTDKMPARPWDTINDEDDKELTKVVDNFLQSRFDGVAAESLREVT